MFEGEEKSLTWEDYTITCDDEVIAGYSISSSDSESEVEEMVMIYFVDTEVSVVLYSAEE